MGLLASIEEPCQLRRLAKHELPAVAVELRRELIDAAAEAGGHFADIAPLYANEAYHGPLGRPTWVGPGDWFHPNDAGHAAIAAVVLRALAISA